MVFYLRHALQRRRSERISLLFAVSADSRNSPGSHERGNGSLHIFGADSSAVLFCDACSFYHRTLFQPHGDTQAKTFSLDKNIRVCARGHHVGGFSDHTDQIFSAERQGILYPDQRLQSYRGTAWHGSFFQRSGKGTQSQDQAPEAGYSDTGACAKLVYNHGDDSDSAFRGRKGGEGMAEQPYCNTCAGMHIYLSGV
ncbi:MAG TPA: hypothetical protein IAB54_05335 [Candidatus Scatomonas merdigallinarum]|nr:hypothetical protein [Candidatus Scatomonas merdigallinarum]